jgi:hypothetical protein
MEAIPLFKLVFALVNAGNPWVFADESGQAQVFL